MQMTSRFTRSLFLLLSSCLLISAYGCSQPEIQLEVTPPPTVEQPNPVEPTSAAAEEVTSGLAIAGIEDAQAAKDFLSTMRAAAVEGDRTTLVNLVHYPFTTYRAGEPNQTYNTPADLLADFDQVITPPVLEAMAIAEYADLFLNYQGAMIGDGEVWFTQFDDSIKISAINS